MIAKRILFATACSVLATVGASSADDDVLDVDSSLERSKELIVILPPMDAREGRQLFAVKGCVICHEINGVGGQHGKAPNLDASRMPIEPDPFVFATRMWRGAKKMIAV